MTKIERSSGNVFEDLGFKNPEEAKTKAQLARLISKKIRERNLTQVQAGEVLEVDQPKVSNLMRGKLREFSVDRLMRFIVALGGDVTIMVEDHHNADSKRGQLSVAVTRQDTKTVTVRALKDHLGSRSMLISRHRIDIGAVDFYGNNPAVSAKHYYSLPTPAGRKNLFCDPNEPFDCDIWFTTTAATTSANIPSPQSEHTYIPLESTKHG